MILRIYEKSKISMVCYDLQWKEYIWIHVPKYHYAFLVVSVFTGLKEYMYIFSQNSYNFHWAQNEFWDPDSSSKWVLIYFGGLSMSLVAPKVDIDGQEVLQQTIVCNLSNTNTSIILSEDAMVSKSHVRV